MERGAELLPPVGPHGPIVRQRILKKEKRKGKSQNRSHPRRGAAVGGGGGELVSRCCLADLVGGLVGRGVGRGRG